MNEEKTMSQTSIEKTTMSLLEKYSSLTEIRTAVQFIPLVGGPLDALFGGFGAEIQQRRIQHFLDELHRRLENIEASPVLANDEKFADLMLNVLTGVIRTRTEEKRKLYAELVTKKIESNRNWDEAEAACRLLNELTYDHILILNTAVNAPSAPGRKHGRRIVLRPRPAVDGEVTSVYLSDIYANLGTGLLRMYCSELVSRGLLLDVGVNELSGGPLDTLSPTSLADWFLSSLGKQETATT